MGSLSPNQKAHRGIWLLLCASFTVLLAGCGKSGPATTDTTSASIPALKDRVEFLQQYVTFRRTYDSLDFAIQYRNNNGGMVPGPSDCDIRLVAIVPAAEISDWIPAEAPVPKPDTAWLKSVPTSLDLSGVDEWYVDGSKTVGLNRAKRIVVYWLFAI